MGIRLKKGIFIRHSARESIIWCPQSSGCTVMQDCQPILEEFGNEWREESAVVDAIARKFECAAEDVKGDFDIVLCELVSQGFVDCNKDARVDDVANNGASIEIETSKEYDEEFLLTSFCDRHGIPVELHLDLTDVCTERCVHCYVPKGQKDFLSVELVEKSLEEFRAMNGLSVHLTGGEAMLHPDFERICRKCVELNLNFIIFSNMTLCDDKRIAFLKEVAPQFINVSLYSMKPEEHDAITQLPGSWQRTMNAILKCEAESVHCRIATPVLKMNKNALPDLKKFADERQMLLVPSYEIVARSDHSCGNLLYACSIDELHSVLACNHGLFHKTYAGAMPLCEQKVCDIGEGRLYLSAKGNYYPCDSMHEYVLGNVREDTVEEIWAGEKLNYLRGLKNRDFGECASCEKRPWCKVCPAANFNATGDIFKHHPNTCTLAGVIRDVYGKMSTRDA